MLSAAKHLCSSLQPVESDEQLQRSFARRKAWRAQDDKSGRFSHSFGEGVKKSPPGGAP
jgi:hypothetical protein